MKTRGNKFMWFSLALALTCAWTPCGAAEDRSESDRGGQAIDDLLAGRFQWKISEPLVCSGRAARGPVLLDEGPDGRLPRRGDGTSSARSAARSGRHQIEYLSFADWKDADARRAARADTIHDGFYCAPQVFYFTPHKKWYLIYQAGDESVASHEYGPPTRRRPTSPTPTSWTQAQPPLDGQAGPRGKAGLDYWIICDDQKAYLFFTTLRRAACGASETPLADFPGGWSEPRSWRSRPTSSRPATRTGSRAWTST